MSERVNALLNGVRVHAVRSDLFSALDGARYDVIVSNPPYVPAETEDLPTSGPERAWDAGLDGRVAPDRLLAEAPPRLRPGGALIVVQSDIIGTERTVEAME